MLFMLIVFFNINITYDFLCYKLSKQYRENKAETPSNTYLLSNPFYYYAYQTAVM